MLQRDYIVAMLKQLSEVLTRYLCPAVVDADSTAIDEVEGAIGNLMNLEGSVALSLDPNSLVTMFELSGIADSVAGYVSYVLVRLGDAYDQQGNGERAQLRRAQAQAISTAFGSKYGAIPEEYTELERIIAAERGEE